MLEGLGFLSRQENLLERYLPFLLGTQQGKTFGYSIYNRDSNVRIAPPSYSVTKAINYKESMPIWTGTSTGESQVSFWYLALKTVFQH